MSNELDVISAKVTEALSQVAPISLYSGVAGRPTSFDFVAAAPTISSKIYDFWAANKRTPALLFNDGMPPSWKDSLYRDPAALNGLITFVTGTEYRIEVQGDLGPVQVASTVGAAIFNCKLLASPGATWTYFDDALNREVTISLSGAYNSRVLGPGRVIPLDKFSVGAFQTWGLLMLAAQFPYTVFPSDDGFLITTDGVAILERTCAYWTQKIFAENLPGAGDESYISSILKSTIGDGPHLSGIPYPIYEMLKQKYKDSGTWTKMAMKAAEIAIGLAGFAFGMSALAGLAGGAFTIPNLSSAVSMAGRFGVDTGNLGPALKVVGALTGDMNIADTFTNSAAGASDMSFGFVDTWGSTSFGDVWGAGLGEGWTDTAVASDWADWASGFSNFGENLSSSFTSTNFLDPLANFSNIDYGNYGGDPWGFADIGASYGPSYFDFGSFDAHTIFDDFFPVNDYAVAVEGFGAAPVYDAVAIQAENDAALAAAMGPVSATQYAAAAKAAPAVASAATAALRSTGANPASTGATPQQVAAATQVARQQMTQAPAAEKSIWEQALGLLGMYGQYQIAAQQATARQQIPTSGLQYPTAQQSVVRQPDGSITMRQPDGSLITVRPDGTTVQTAAGNSLPGFLAQNKTMLLIAGGALLAVGLAVAVSRR